jgi:hypothetical protein
MGSAGAKPRPADGVQLAAATSTDPFADLPLPPAPTPVRQAAPTPADRTGPEMARVAEDAEDAEEATMPPPAALAETRPVAHQVARPADLPDLDAPPAPADPASTVEPPPVAETGAEPAPKTGREKVARVAAEQEPLFPPKPEMATFPKEPEPAPAPNADKDPGPATAEPGQGHPAAPAVRMVNSKHITINYEVKGVGPSGLSGVELWCTRDGKTWKKRDVAPRARPPYVVEVEEEGLYGFTLLAKNGIGLGKDAPQPGDLPQIWVEVDMTRPVVQLTGINANCSHNSQNVVIRWKASDKNLGPRPITLAYATAAHGPWQSIAANVPNTGRYVWPLPAEAPARFLVRVEAADLVGNVGSAQTPKPVLMDRAQPTVSILDVEADK